MTKSYQAIRIAVPSFTCVAAVMVSGPFIANFPALGAINSNDSVTATEVEGSVLAKQEATARSNGKEPFSLRISGARAQPSTGVGDSARVKWAKCDVDPHNPHWSKKGQTVIFKTSITCEGTFRWVDVKTWRKLCKPLQEKCVASAKSTRRLRTNGVPAIVYTPKMKSHKKVIQSATYKGGVTGKIIAPGSGSVIRGGHSKTVYVQTPLNSR